MNIQLIDYFFIAYFKLINAKNIFKVLEKQYFLYLNLFNSYLIYFILKFVIYT